MTISLPNDVSYIINTLLKDGCEAYAVGGCVRDSILGRAPDDWDITTSALPEHTKSLFRRTVDTGIKHGTVTVMIDRTGYEVTTYRVDGKYTDSRHPDSVSFTRSLSEDLKRRDFTINAMAYNDAVGLVDLFDGVGDLDRHIIRCVGTPAERFSEDALRILRAVRFSAQLGFEIDTATSLAAAELAHTLVNISAERIHAELDKLIMSPHPDRLMTLHSLGLDRFILPELNSLFLSGDAAERLIGLLSSAPRDIMIRWALLLRFTGRANTVLRRLKSDNKSLNTVMMLLRFCDRPIPEDRRAMRVLAREAGAANIPLLLNFIATLFPEHDLSHAEQLYAEMTDNGEATAVRDLALTGTDLIRAGIPEGRAVGETLEHLLDAVIEDPSLNTREALLNLL